MLNIVNFAAISHLHFIDYPIKIVNKASILSKLDVNNILITPNYYEKNAPANINGIGYLLN